MDKQKQTYLSPETEILVVQFEGCVLTGSNKGNTPVFDGYDDEGWD